mmetsp:Transcript_130007/g.323993  ORF Transcript_130007/g.323993 Transcript_130007/m.323993 type:complete len:217 (-) Transcript_130007:1772-2422(-)
MPGLKFEACANSQRPLPGNRPDCTVLVTQVDVLHRGAGRGQGHRNSAVEGHGLQPHIDHAMGPPGDAGPRVASDDGPHHEEALLPRDLLLVAGVVGVVENIRPALQLAEDPGLGFVQEAAGAAPAHDQRRSPGSRDVHLPERRKMPLRHRCGLRDCLPPLGRRPQVLGDAMVHLQPSQPEALGRNDVLRQRYGGGRRLWFNSCPASHTQLQHDVEG